MINYLHKTLLNPYLFFFLSLSNTYQNIMVDNNNNDLSPNNKQQGW